MMIHTQNPRLFCAASIRGRTLMAIGAVAVIVLAIVATRSGKPTAVAPEAATVVAKAPLSKPSLALPESVTPVATRPSVKASTPKRVDVASVASDKDSVSHVAPAGTPTKSVPALDEASFDDNAEPVFAKVEAGGKLFDVTPNQDGQFERIYVQAGEKVKIDMVYPQGNAGEKISVTMEDGGVMEDGKTAGARTLGEGGRLQLTPQIGTELGVYRLTVRKGGMERIFDFWVGAPLSVRALTKK